MISYSIQVNGTDHEKRVEDFAEIIMDTNKILSGNAVMKSEQLGIKLTVSFAKENSNFEKVLEGLGFTLQSKEEGDQSARKPRKPRKVTGGKLLPRKYERKLIEAVEADPSGGIPSGCYRHDGSQDRYYARTLQLKLAAKEFGPGVRFERDSDHTWWVVVELTNGQYGLKPATD